MFSFNQAMGTSGCLRCFRSSLMNSVVFITTSAKTARCCQSNINLRSIAEENNKTQQARALAQQAEVLALIKSS